MQNKLNNSVSNIQYKENKCISKECINDINMKENIEDTYFYLDQNIDEIKKYKIIKRYSHIRQSNIFPNNEYEEYFKKRYDNFYEKNHNQFFYEFFLKEKQMQPLQRVNIENLVIFCTTAEIDHIYTRCKIMAIKSQLSSFFSIFLSQNLEKTEYGIEITSKSNAIFKNCHFYDAERVAVLVHNDSSATFEHCIFENNHISCFLKNGSNAKFINCKFINDKLYSIFATENCMCEIIDCEFLNLEGRAIFSKETSEIHVTNADFVNCKKGAALIVNSKMILNNVVIHNSDNTALRAIEQSQIFANYLSIEDTNGNAFNIENSTGYIINCNISGTNYITIAINGCDSNPIFYNCKINDNRNTFCVNCCNGSRPLFDHCSFADCQTNCFSVLNFSCPHIQNCNFTNISNFYMNAFSGSYITFDNIESGDGDDLSNKISIKKSSKCEYKTYNDIEKDADQFKYKNGDTQNNWMKMQEIINEISLQYLKKINVNDIVKINESSLKCSHCHKELNNEDQPHMITNCKHIYCNNCKNIDRCSICDANATEIQKLFLENECVICLDKKPNTISLPCGHVCMCYDCSLKISEKEFKCPMCNQTVDNYHFIFDEI